MRLLLTTLFVATELELGDRARECGSVESRNEKRRTLKYEQNRRFYVSFGVRPDFCPLMHPCIYCGWLAWLVRFVSQVGLAPSVTNPNHLIPLIPNPSLSLPSSLRSALFPGYIPEPSSFGSPGQVASLRSGESGVTLVHEQGEQTNSKLYCVAQHPPDTIDKHLTRFQLAILPYPVRAG